MMKVNIYKCPACTAKFKTLNGWGDHVKKHHSELIPDGYTIPRFFYFTVTSKDHGTCRVCKGKTTWNDESWKYNQYCDNPDCKEKYRMMFKKRMIDRHGKVHLLNDPNIQRKMQMSRKISGMYKFKDKTEINYTGSYEKDFLTMMDTFLHWKGSDIMGPSPHTYYYDYKNPSDKENEGRKFYIPDYYIPSLNLEIEIKQSTSTHHKILAVDKVKEKLKDDIMNNNKSINYIKINDKDYSNFFDYLLELKEMVEEHRELDGFVSGNIANESMIDTEIDEIAMEGPVEMLALTLSLKAATTIGKGVTKGVKSAINTNKQKKSERADKFNIYHQVSVKNHIIEIRGLNIAVLERRIVETYDDKSINNIFQKKYNAKSYKKFTQKKINRTDMKVDYLYVPEFFALELVNLFEALYGQYGTKTYKQIANKIYEMTWLKNSDMREDETKELSTANLSRLALELKEYQADFIRAYPKLKASLYLRGVILSFVQGLGKTLTSIGLAECLDKERIYIVCPNNLTSNWALEIKKYYTKFSDEERWKEEVFICNGSFSTYNKDKARFIIINNESIEKMFPYIEPGKTCMLILDESHNFRNHTGKRTKQLMELRDRLIPNNVDILVMSGTPIKGTPSEIVPALLLIDPSFTPTAANIYTKAFKLNNVMGTTLIQSRFNKVIYRKDKTMLPDLPKKNVVRLPLIIKESNKYHVSNIKTMVVNRFMELYKIEMQEYEKYRKEFIQLIDRYYKHGTDDALKKYYLSWVIKLNTDEQMVVHELDEVRLTTFIDDYIKDNVNNPEDLKRINFLQAHFLSVEKHCMGKAIGEIIPPHRKDLFISLYEENKTMIRNLIEKRPEKTVIFSQFKPVIDYICDDLNNNTNISAVKIHGDVPQRDRLLALQRFQEDDCTTVLCATSQSLGTGVTLVEASQMFFFGTPWRSADFEQCCDRIHRIGQMVDVTIYNVLLDTGNIVNLSTRIDSILNWSQRMFESSIDSNQEEIDKLAMSLESSGLDSIDYTQIFVIEPTDNIEDLYEQKYRWLCMNPSDKAYSDTISLNRYGVRNLEHFYILLSKLETTQKEETIND